MTEDRNQPTILFKLEHVYERDGCEEFKLIGIYSTRAKAQEALERVKVQPGFRDHVTGFTIHEHMVDQDGWIDGFETITY